VLERVDLPPDELGPALEPRGQRVWLEVEGLGDERVLRRIAELLHIHPLALADIVNVGQRPKADAYDGFELVICRMARAREGQALELEQVSLVLTRDVVVSFHEGERDLFDPVRARIRQGAVIRSMGTDYLAYALVDMLVDGYYPMLESVGEQLEELEDRVSERPGKELLSEIHRTRRQLLAFSRLVRQQRDAVAAMMRADHPLISDAVRVYLRDSLDHATQISDVLDSFRESALGLVEIYLSSVGQRTNEIIKVLTILSSIFIPLTFIVGVYGMNFEHMPELRWKYGYLMTWALMAAVVGGLLWYFRRNGWIGAARDEPD
jgi:magnesium transporter